MDEFLTEADAVPAQGPGVPNEGTAAPQSFHQQMTRAPAEPSPMEAKPQQATPEEQGQYTDLMSRVLKFVHDTSEDEDGVSNADRVMNMLAVKTEEFWKPLGAAVATIMQLFHNNAKRQGVEYEGWILQQVGFDLTEELYSMADELGFVDMGEEGSDEYTPEEEDTIEQAYLEAHRQFGEYLKSTGQLDQEKRRDAMGVMQEQMQREARQGELDDWEGPEATPELVNSLIQQGVQTNGRS